MTSRALTEDDVRRIVREMLDEAAAAEAAHVAAFWEARKGWPSTAALIPGQGPLQTSGSAYRSPADRPEPEEGPQQ